MERSENDGPFALPPSSTDCHGTLTPPTTIIAANTVVYLESAFLYHVLPSTDEVWFNSYLILKLTPPLFYHNFHPPTSSINCQRPRLD
ncbi:unnamed protein product [Linum trigynum]|uniref:Uncharacterized protein n=1 Tax=Linum trigynum TaxID=586398 RepID=A0AAV2CNN8_9ROSI